MRRVAPDPDPVLTAAWPSLAPAAPPTPAAAAAEAAHQARWKAICIYPLLVMD